VPIELQESMLAEDYRGPQTEEPVPFQARATHERTHDMQAAHARTQARRHAGTHAHMHTGTQAHRHIQAGTTLVRARRWMVGDCGPVPRFRGTAVRH
jgi:hypothetical protein